MTLFQSRLPRSSIMSPLIVLLASASCSSIIVSRSVQSSDLNVVVGIFVIRDQNTAILVACELNFVRVNLVNGCDDGLSVLLEHHLCWTDGSGGKLTVDLVINCNVASHHVQSDSMSAQGLRCGCGCWCRCRFGGRLGCGCRGRGWPFDNNVVVGIFVIRDQSTAIHVASELNFVRVYSADGDNEGLTILLKNDLLGVDSSSCQLRVNPRGHISVSTDQVEYHSVGARRAQVLLASLSARELIFVVSPSSFAVEDLGARSNHLWRKGKLLAVENESSPLVLNVVLSVVTNIEELIGANSKRVDGVILNLHVLQHGRSPLHLALNQLLRLLVDIVHILDLRLQPLEVLLECLERHHHLSFVPQAGLVVGLVKNFRLFAEVVHDLVEVGARKPAVIVGVRVVLAVVGWIVEVARVLLGARRLVLIYFCLARLDASSEKSQNSWCKFHKLSFNNLSRWPFKISQSTGRSNEDRNKTRMAQTTITA